MAKGGKRVFNVMLSAILVFAMAMGFTVVTASPAQAEGTVGCEVKTVTTGTDTPVGQTQEIPFLTYNNEVAWCYDWGKNNPAQNDSSYIKSNESVKDPAKNVLYYYNMFANNPTAAFSDLGFSSSVSVDFGNYEGPSPVSENDAFKIATQLALWAISARGEQALPDSYDGILAMLADQTDVVKLGGSYPELTARILYAAQNRTFSNNLSVERYDNTDPSSNKQSILALTEEEPADPSISTKAWGDKNGGSLKTVKAEPGIVVYDDVTLVNILEDEGYELVSSLVLLDSSNKPVGQPLKTSKKEFTVGADFDGKIAVQFDPVDLSSYGSGEYKLAVTAELSIRGDWITSHNSSFDNRDQTLEIEATTPDNPSYVTVTVTKKWVESDGTTEAAAPNGAYVKVHLLQNGDLASDDVTLDASNNWTYTWKDLTEGEEYTVEETEFKGDGFAQGTVVKGEVANGDIPFTITNKKKADPAPDPTPTPDPTPDPQTRTVSFSKTDLDGNALAGATMQLLNADGKVLEEWKSEVDAHVATLAFGDYKLHELYAPEGYFVASDVAFTVSEDQAVDATKVVAMKDKPWPTITISKVDDSTGKELAGASLEVRNANAKAVDSWTSTAEPHAVKLAPGTYTLVETKAPAGYAVAGNVTFEVGENGLTSGDKVVMKDKKTAAAASRSGLAKTGDGSGAALLAVALASVAGATVIATAALRRRKR